MFYPVVYEHPSLSFPISEVSLEDIGRGMTRTRKGRRIGSYEVRRLPFGRGFILIFDPRRSRLRTIFYNDGSIYLDVPEESWKEDDKEYLIGSAGRWRKLLTQAIMMLSFSGYSRWYVSLKNKLFPSYLLSTEVVKSWMGTPPIASWMAENDLGGSMASSRWKEHWSPVLKRAFADGVIKLETMYSKLPTIGTARKTLPWLPVPPKELFKLYFDVLKFIKANEDKWFVTEMKERIIEEFLIPEWRARRILFDLSLYDLIRYWFKVTPVGVEPKGERVLKRGYIRKGDLT